MGLLALAGPGIGLLALADHVWWRRVVPALPGAILFGVLSWHRGPAGAAPDLGVPRFRQVTWAA